MSDTQETTLRRVMPAVLLLSLTIGFFSPVLFQDQTFYAFDILQRYPPWQGNPALVSQASINNQLITDPLNIFYIAHETYQEGLRQGGLPFWRHGLFAGTPFTPYFGSPVHYTLFSIFPVTIAHDLLLFLHMALMGLMMYLYLKKLNLVTTAALFGAISWMFNGYVMVWFEFENVAMMALTLPGSLYFIERWFRRSSFQQKSWGNFLGLSGMLSLAMTSGYAHLLMYQLLLIGAYVAFRYYTFTPGIFSLSISQHFRSLSGPMIALLVSLMAGSLFLASHLSLMQEGHRQAIPFNDLYESTGELPGRYLITLIFPHFYGSPTLQDGYLDFVPKDNLAAYPYNNFNELCIYGGIVTLLFALIGMLYSKRVSGGRFFVLTYLICIAIAMGSIIYWPLATFLPGLSFSTPTRVLYISGFAICVLAAFGMQIVVARMYHQRWPILVIAAMLLLISTGTIFMMQEPILQRAVIEDWLQAYQIPWSRLSSLLEAHFALSSETFLLPLGLMSAAIALLSGLLYVPENRQLFLVILLFVLMIYDQAGFGRNYNSLVDRQAVFPETPGIEFLKADESLFRVAATSKFLPNGMLPFGIDDVGGYSSFLPRRFGELLHLVENPQITDLEEVILRQWYNFETLESPILSMLNTKYLLASPGVRPESAENLTLVYQGEMDIYENSQVFPRAWFVAEAVYVPDRQTAYKELAIIDHEDLRNTVILEGDKPTSVAVSGAEGDKNPGVVINYIQYGTNRISVSADVPQPGFIVLSTNYHPDWKAKIHGQDAIEEIRPRIANYSLMAIPVAAGPQEVMLHYEPAGQVSGFRVSLFVWFLLIVAILHYLIGYLRRSLTDRQQGRVL